MFEQYDEYLSLKTALKPTLVDTRKLIEKFRRTVIESIYDAMTAPVFVLVYVGSVLFAYEICNPGVEIWISNGLKGYAVAPEPFAGDPSGTLFPVSCEKYTDDKGREGWYSTTSGSISMLYFPVSTSFSYMPVVIFMYGAAAFLRRSKYMLYVLVLLVTHLFLRVAIFYKDPCRVLNAAQADKALSGVIIILESFGLLFTFSTNRRFRFLHAMCRYAWPKLRSLVVIVSILVYVYGTSAKMLFGYENYSDCFASAFNLVVGGNANYQKDYGNEAILAIVWYITLTFLGMLVVYNMVIAVLSDSYARAARKIYDTKKVRECIGLDWRFLFQFSPYHAYKISRVLSQCDDEACSQIPDRPYLAFLEEHYGQNLDLLYGTCVKPIVDVFGHNTRLGMWAEKEAFVRLMEIEHAIGA